MRDEGSAQEKKEIGEREREREKSQWPPTPALAETSAQVLTVLRRVLDQKFGVTLVSTDVEESQRMGEICHAIGWGIRFSFSVVTTQAELLAELTPSAKAVDSSAKADSGTAGADVQTGQANEDSEQASAVDIVLLDTSIGDPLMQLVLEDCTERRVPVVCECGPRVQSAMRLASHPVLLFAVANPQYCI